MKKLFILILIFWFIPVFAADNTHSTDIEQGDLDAWSISDANQTGLEPSGDFTVEAWVNLESLTADHTVMGKWSTGQWLIRIDSGDVIININDGAGSNCTITEFAITTGSWQHIAITYDASAGGAEGFADGSPVGTCTGLKTSIQDIGDAFQIGTFGVSNGPYDGLIDDARFWDVIRTDSEISANYNKCLVGNEANLQGYWKFDDDGTDETSNNNDLTEINTPVFTTNAAFDDSSCGVGVAGNFQMGIAF